MSERQVDQALVERVQNGEKAAYDLLVLKYQHKVNKLVGRFVRDHSEVLDVSQEAFIKAYRALPNFRGDSAFYTWLYRIAINTAKNYLASRKRRPIAMDLGTNEEQDYSSEPRLRDDDTPERLLLQNEIQQTVAKTIANLPKDLKLAVSLRELEGLSYEEIAEAMDCPIGTVRSRIFRAREAINRELEPLLD